MKLGVVVVYMVHPENGPLLDLHLRQLERCTTVPFTVYASANRLLPKFRAILDQKPYIKLFSIPPSDVRRSKEHAWQLERLVQEAVADGSTHVVTLHVDSFPVRPGWIEELLPHLAGSCVAAAVLRSECGDVELPLTAGLLFTRTFWLEYQPRFLPSQEIRESPAFRTFEHRFGVKPDSGSGYGFTMHTHGLRWHRLLRSKKRDDHYLFAGVYGDLIFHLGSAASDTLQRDVAKVGGAQRALGRFLSAFKRLSLVQRVRLAVRSILPARVVPAARLGMRMIARMHEDETTSTFQAIRRKLLDDPEGYLLYLRTGEAIGSSRSKA
jgi:hypothetical protein